MKKRFIAFGATVLAAACCLGSCGEQPDGYDALNEMLHKDYSQIVLTVTDTFDGEISLTSVYTVKYSNEGVTVDYKVERFSVLTPDAPSTDVKTTFTGTAVVEDGVIVSAGEEVGFSSIEFVTGLAFKGEYFENAELTDAYMIADVKDADAFMGTEISCTEMKATAVFYDVFYTINITYTSASGSRVKYLYEFTV